MPYSMGMKTTTYRVTEWRGTKWGDAIPMTIAEGLTLEAAKRLADKCANHSSVWDNEGNRVYQG